MSSMVKDRLWRNRHEPVSSQPYHENLLNTKDSRLRASARHGWAGVVLNFAHRSAVGSSLCGAAAIIVSEGESGSNPRIMSE